MKDAVRPRACEAYSIGDISACMQDSADCSPRLYTKLVILSHRREQRPMSMATVTPRNRLKSPASIIPEAMAPLQALGQLLGQLKGAPARALALAMLRASQINGCALCLDGSCFQLKQAGETDERLFAVSAWRESTRFTAPERAALALSEAMTRLSDRSDPVPDTIWDEAARHFQERELAYLVLGIATINLYNRINVTTNQVAAEWDRDGGAKKT
jgi:AhpD family alkylhydroperoxidase